MKKSRRGSGGFFSGLLGGATGGAAGGASGAKGGGIKLLAKILGVVSIVAILAKGLEPFLRPILQLLTLFVFLLFLPLVPILKRVLPPLAGFLKSFADFMKNITDKFDKVLDFLFGGGIVDFVKNFFGSIFDSLVEAWNALKEFPQFLINNILIPAWKGLKNIGRIIVSNIILPAFRFLSNIGELIWKNILMPAFDWFKDIGTRIWNFIKGGFTLFKDAIKAAANALITLINKIPGVNIKKFQTGGFVPGPIGKPQLALLHGGEQVLTPRQQMDGGGALNLTVNFNNPIVQGQQDMDKLADVVSRVLQNQLRRRIS